MTNIVLPNFQKKHVVVVGDVMLDRYYHGDTSRISPEAPVAVLNVDKVELRAGGAANVALNIATLGASVTLIGLVGEDHAARELQTCLAHLPVDCRFIVVPDFLTITKSRVIGRQQQLIRMDFEKSLPVAFDGSALQAEYDIALKTADLVILSDYSKGALDHVEALIAAAKQKNIPVLIDPKHKDYSRYAGATLLTPNRKEFESIVGNCDTLEDIEKKAADLIKKTGIASLLVTLGKDGMLYCNGGVALHYPTKARDVFDVTGAGDTVIAVSGASLAAGMEVAKAVELSNIAAGVTVAHLGAYAVSLDDLHHALRAAGDTKAGLLSQDQLLLLVKDAKKRGERIVMTNGCFDILHVGHVDYLTKAKALGNRLIVAVNDDNSVRRLKGDSRPFNPVDARMMILASLKCVDWVVAFSEDTPQRLIEAVGPDVLVKGGDYRVEDIAGSEYVLKQKGEVKIIPLVDGFSTTALAKKMGSAS